MYIKNCTSNIYMYNNNLHFAIFVNLSVLRYTQLYRTSLYVALNVCGKSRAWNANLVVYEHNHVYGDYNMHSKRVTFRTHSTLCIGAFGTLFSFIIYS